MKAKFEKINQSKLPANIKSELEGIKDATKDFSDKDIMEIEQENFDALYSLIEKKHPEALGLKPAKEKPVKKVKKPAKAKVALSDFEKQLAECREVLKKNRKPKKEPVKHTRESRLVNHLKGVFNVILEVQKDSPEKIDSAQKKISKFYGDIREDFLGLERKGLPEKFKKKAEQKKEKAEEKK